MHGPSVRVRWTARTLVRVMGYLHGGSHRGKSQEHQVVRCKRAWRERSTEQQS